MFKSKPSLCIERMEDRHMMTSVGLVNGDIVIEGSNNDDVVTVDDISVVRFENGRFVNVPQIYVQVDDGVGRPIQRAFDADDVRAIRADLFDGDDQFTNDTAKTSIVRGGDDNDVLKGGRGSDIFHGGNGDDTLYGRSGRDYLSGNNGNDGLFGGKGFDRMTGGSGADRYLTDQSSPDFIRGKYSNDTQIRFERGDTYRGEIAGQEDEGEFVSNGRNWTDAEIEQVDAAFALLHQRTNNVRLLERFDGTELRMQRNGDFEKADGKPFEDENGNPLGVAGLNFQDGRIMVTQVAFDAGENMVKQTVLHEIGHNFDEPGEFVRMGRFSPVSMFYAASGWSTTSSVGRTTAELDQYEKRWFFKENTNFVSDYATTTAHEDFAETFAAYFMQNDFIGSSYDGDPIGINNVPEKRQILDLMFSLID